MIKSILLTLALLVSAAAAAELPQLSCDGKPLPGRFVKKLFPLDAAVSAEALAAAYGPAQHVARDEGRQVVRYFCYDPSMPLVRWELPGAPIKHSHEYGFVLEGGMVTGLFYRHVMGAHFERGAAL